MTNPWHRLSPRVKRTVQVAVLIGIIGFVVDLSVVVGFGLSHPAVPHKVDAVIVLGAKVGTPALKYRTLKGLEYYQQGKTDTLVLSGARGSNEPVSEAEAMKSVIQDEVTKTHDTMPHLVLETRSMDTFQNLQNSKALLPHAKSIVVVSDGYHLARSVAFARHVGFQTVYWSSPKPWYYGTIDLAHYYVREAVAIVVYLPQLI